MSPAPRASILLPVFNARSFLDDCLRSVMEQTFTDFEVLAVDDGSRDGSREVLESWAAADDRVRILRRPHLGLTSTLNAGLDACRGEVIARMDADDVIHPRRLERQVHALSTMSDVDVVSCKIQHFPESDVAEGFKVYEEWLNGLVTHREIMRERFIESPIPHPTAVMLRSTLVEVGGYHDHGWPEDYDLWLRLAQAGKRFHKIPETLYFWREHNLRLTRTDSRYAVEKFLACKANYLLSGPLANVRKVIVWGAGQTGRRLSKHLIRGGAPLDSFIDIDPAKVGRTLRGRPICAPAELPRLFAGRDRTILLVAVASRGARQLIRERLAGAGLDETEHFWIVA